MPHKKAAVGVIMSNVLIGIIGVILFIGLALAGALILGDDFRTAGASSKAATIVQGLQQTAIAYNMNTIRTGAPIPSSQGANIVSTLIANKRLKVAPINPVRTDAGGDVAAYDIVGTRTPSRPIHVLTMHLGSFTPNSPLRNVCYEIEAQMGAQNPERDVDTAIGFDVKLARDQRAGCMLNLYSNQYVAYMPV